MINNISSEGFMIICLITGYINKLLCKMSCYSEPDSDRNKFELICLIKEENLI